tara:strand:+ start:99 stop:515 length:417 start_codon:yes stop_codon:yes gene_type:complete
MLGFISFGIKIIFASILGGVLNYIPGDSKNNQYILETSLICIFSTAIVGLLRQLPGTEFSTMGFGVLVVLLVILAISKNMEFGKRIIWLFAGVIGMIIGAGFIIQACLLCALVYAILRNCDNLLSYIHNNEQMSDSNI